MIGCNVVTVSARVQGVCGEYNTNIHKLFVSHTHANIHPQAHVNTRTTLLLTYTHTHIPSHTQTYTRLSLTHTCIRTCKHPYIHTHTHTQCTETHTQRYTHKHIPSHTISNTHTHIHTHTHTNTHTYTHTQTHKAGQLLLTFSRWYLLPVFSVAGWNRQLPLVPPSGRTLLDTAPRTPPLGAKHKNVTGIRLKSSNNSPRCWGGCQS